MSKNTKREKSSFLIVKEEELKVEGIDLIQRLFQTANTKQHNMEMLCGFIGISTGYLGMLKNGSKPISGLKQDAIRNCAAYIGTSVYHVQRLGGIIKAQDYFHTEANVENILNSALNLMSHTVGDKMALPESLFNADIETKFYVVQLFEKMTGRKILDTIE